MVNYELKQENFTLTTLKANDDKHAWDILKRMGIRNRSKTLKLIRIDNDEVQQW